MAAIELAVGDLGGEFRPMVSALAIATRSLSRELAGPARPTQLIPRQLVADRPGDRSSADLMLSEA